MAYYQHPRLSVSEKWLAEKIIHPSTSEYALPAVLVSNKNGRKRLLYQNYRKLNESLINPMQSDGSHGERVRQATGVQKTNTIHQIHHGSSKGAY